MERLFETLKSRGANEITKKRHISEVALFSTFHTSWEKVESESARNIFKLASFFPETRPIPLWLLGLAADLGEDNTILEPLGEARFELQQWSLIEDYIGENIQLHPLLREFARKLVSDDPERDTLLVKAGERLDAEFVNLKKLEQRALRIGYWRCLEQVHTASEYKSWLGVNRTGRLGQIERWLDRESYLLGDERWWPEKIPGLYYQQLYNWSVEDGYPLVANTTQSRWLKLIKPVNAGNQLLRRIFGGHSGNVVQTAFSPDGKLVLTCSSDWTARLWETSSGRLLSILAGHTDMVTSIVFSSDGKLVLTGSLDKTARLWEANSGRLLSILKMHSASITCVTFSPDGSKALTGSSDRGACLWETASGKQLAVLSSHTRQVTCAVFSPDGSRVLTGSSDRTARLWEVASGNY